MCERLHLPRLAKEAPAPLAEVATRSQKLQSAAARVSHRRSGDDLGQKERGPPPWPASCCFPHFQSSKKPKKPPQITAKKLQTLNPSGRSSFRNPETILSEFSMLFGRQMCVSDVGDGVAESLREACEARTRIHGWRRRRRNDFWMKATEHSDPNGWINDYVDGWICSSVEMI